MVYSISEDAGSVLLQVAVLDGSFDTDVMVRLVTRDGSAVCKKLVCNYTYIASSSRSSVAYLEVLCCVVI